MAFLETIAAVLIGGGVSLGTMWFFERRREQRDDAKSRAAFKAAARITYTDMGVIRRNLRQTLKERLWYPFTAMPMSVVAFPARELLFA